MLRLMLVVGVAAGFLMVPTPKSERALFARKKKKVLVNPDGSLPVVGQQPYGIVPVAVEEEAVVGQPFGGAAVAGEEEPVVVAEPAVVEEEGPVVEEIALDPEIASSSSSSSSSLDSGRLAVEAALEAPSIPASEAALEAFPEDDEVAASGQAVLAKLEAARAAPEGSDSLEAAIALEGSDSGALEDKLEELKTAAAALDVAAASEEAKIVAAAIEAASALLPADHPSMAAAETRRAQLVASKRLEEAAIGEIEDALAVAAEAGITDDEFLAPYREKLERARVSMDAVLAATAGNDVAAVAAAIESAIDAGVSPESREIAAATAKRAALLLDDAERRAAAFPPDVAALRDAIKIASDDAAPDRVDAACAALAAAERVATLAAEGAAAKAKRDEMIAALEKETLVQKIDALKTLGLETIDQRQKRRDQLILYLAKQRSLALCREWCLEDGTPLFRLNPDGTADASASAGGKRGSWEVLDETDFTSTIRVSLKLLASPAAPPKPHILTGLVAADTFDATLSTKLFGQDIQEPCSLTASLP